MTDQPKPPPNVLDTALSYARAGHPVFPCESSGEHAKAPLTRHGFKDASTDADLIRRWWKERPDAALGLPTGIAWDVLDVDVKHADGIAALNLIEQFGLIDGHVRQVKTPSSGWHFYFPADPDNQLGCAQAPSAGIDLRGHGGYVIAPPSRTNDDEYEGRYETIWRADKGVAGQPLQWHLIEPLITVSVPPAGRQQGRTPADSDGDPASLSGWVANLQPGERNAGLFWALCRALEAGHEPDPVLEAGQFIGLTQREVSATLRSARQRVGGRRG